MTPKEKALDLYFKYEKEIRIYKTNGFEYNGRKAKNCCLIAVDEIINHHSQEQALYRIDTYYWKEVKQEIEKL